MDFSKNFGGVAGFFSDIASFAQGGRVLGIDIGTSAIKVAEIAKRKGRLWLENYGLLETGDYLSDGPGQAIQTGALKMSETKTSGMLRTLIAEMGTRTKNAVVAIPAFSAFSTIFEMPALTPSEMDKAIAFQARQFIPMSAEKVSVDWTEVGERRDERGVVMKKIFLIGIPNDTVGVYSRVCAAAGIRVSAFELENLALMRLLSLLGAGRACAVDIGALAVNVVVAEGGKLAYASQIETGGMYLTHAIGRGLGLSLTRSEELKRRRGLSDSGRSERDEMELSTLILPTLDVIIEKVRESLSGSFRLGELEVRRGVLVGGGANLSGITGYFSERLGIEFVSPPVLSDLVYDERLRPVADDLARTFAVAVGAAKGFFSKH